MELVYLMSHSLLLVYGEHLRNKCTRILFHMTLLNWRKICQVLRAITWNTVQGTFENMLGLYEKW